MLCARRVHPPGDWPRAAARGEVRLGYDDRHRRRVKLVSDRGEAFLLDLPQAAVLRDGDGLALDDGGWIAVVAAPEPLRRIPAICAGWHGISATATCLRQSPGTAS